MSRRSVRFGIAAGLALLAGVIAALHLPFRTPEARVTPLRLRP